ncbi:hypothetical protein SAMN02787149_102695 [Pseudomonas sp. Snoq117.2]|nr:hypothetical protein SAMN02787149_102695 [Pseudomonas sp. Snoq117.2]
MAGAVGLAVQLIEGDLQGLRFTGPGRTGDEDDAVRKSAQTIEQRDLVGQKAQLIQGLLGFLVIEQSQDHERPFNQRPRGNPCAEEPELSHEGVLDPGVLADLRLIVLLSHVAHGVVQRRAEFAAHAALDLPVLGKQSMDAKEDVRDLAADNEVHVRRATAVSFAKETDDFLLARGTVEATGAGAAGRIDLVQRLDLAQGAGHHAVVQIRAIQLTHEGHDEWVAQMLARYEQLSMIGRAYAFHQSQELTQFRLHRAPLGAFGSEDAAWLERK